MRTYRTVWTVAVGLLVARGLGLGIEHHPALTGTALLAGAVVAALAAASSPGRRARRTAAAALGAGIAVGATVGHLPRIGAGLVVIAILVAATSPGSLRRYERWVESEERSSAFDALVRGLAHAAPGYVPPSALSELTDQDLWDRWRATESALEQPAPPEDVLELVRRREHYLDELDRRDPRRVAAVLALDRREPRR